MISATAVVFAAADNPFCKVNPPSLEELKKAHQAEQHLVNTAPYLSSRLLNKFYCLHVSVGVWVELHASFLSLRISGFRLLNLQLRVEVCMLWLRLRFYILKAWHLRRPMPTEWGKGLMSLPCQPAPIWMQGQFTATCPWLSQISAAKTLLAVLYRALRNTERSTIILLASAELSSPSSDSKP